MQSVRCVTCAGALQFSNNKTINKYILSLHIRKRIYV